MIRSIDIVVFPGDYGGPEVMIEAVKVLRAVEHQYRSQVKFNLDYQLIGGASWDVHRTPITQKAIGAAKAASAVLLGAVGGPKWDGLLVPVESGLGQLRKSMDAFANIRPIKFVATSLISRSALKEYVVKDADIVIVRELTGGIYFGERREHNGDFDFASDVDMYDRTSIERVARMAGKMATSSQPPLSITSLDKANLLAASGRLWRGVVTHIMTTEFPNVSLSHMYIDSAAMTMVCNPARLNGVVLTSNMFGDIISDQASAIPGSIGLLPSASLCSIPEDMTSSDVKGIYEPVHGSAPDIAGQGIINPTGMILSVAMMLRYSLDMPEAALAVEHGVRHVIENGIKTKDIGGNCSTSDFGQAVVAHLRNHAAPHPNPEVDLACSISYCIDANLPREIVNFVTAVVSALKLSRKVKIREITTGSGKRTKQLEPPVLYLTSSTEMVDGVLTILSIREFLDRLSENLDKIDSTREASALRQVAYLCQMETDRGGLGLNNDSATWPLDQALLNEILFLVEAWLEAINSAESVRLPPTPLTKKAHGTRPMTLSEKILAHHALQVPSIKGVKPDDLIRVSVDWIIASELSWVGMKKSMSTIDREPVVWRNDRFWLAGDHTVDPRTYQSPEVRRLVSGLKDAKSRFKMTENQGSNFTILHTEFVRERAEPGMLVIGSDSHTCSGGAVSSLAVGLGAADAMMALATGETYFKVPESIRILLVGEPVWYIRGKDVILHILKELKRNTYAAERIVEFGGPGAKHLSVDARFAISNMCTELGGVTGIFAPDDVTRDFISSRTRSVYNSNSIYFKPDDDAIYAETFVIDLSKVESFMALYPSPDNVVPVTDKIGLKFDGCFIGACTTVEEELILAALVLEVGMKSGLMLAPGKRMVVPGSLPIVKNLEALGLIDIYRRAGFEQPAPGCSMCLGMGADKALQGETWFSSQNRNFKNRMGKGSIGHIGSAATVAASSFSMTLTDPAFLLSQIDPNHYKHLLVECRHVKHRKVKAEKSVKDTRRLEGNHPIAYVEPYLSIENTSSNDDIRGTSAPPEPRGALATIYEGIVSSRVYRLGDFVDTDAIMPADKILGSDTDELLGSHCLEHTNPEFRNCVTQEGMEVVVAGKAFGCGSSREEAARALKGIGIKAVIARSFSFIYGRNGPCIGLLSIQIDDSEFYILAQTGMSIDIDVPNRVVQIGGQTFSFMLDDMELQLIRQGGLPNAYKKFGKQVFQALCGAKGNHKAVAGAGIQKSVNELLEVKLRPSEGVKDQLAW